MSIWSRAREEGGEGGRGKRRKERNEDNERGGEPNGGKRCLKDGRLSVSNSDILNIKHD